MDIAHIHRLAATFRLGIERTAKASLPVMENFPRGACGDAALLLSKYLQENGCGSFEYVLGERGDSSHAWLEQAGVAVDITPDQFADGPSGVYVGPIGLWHAAFAGKAQHVADFEIYDERTKTMLRWAYGNVLASIKAMPPEPNNAIHATCEDARA
jgi:hypothetical protein